MAIHDVSEYIHWNIPPPPFYIENLLPKQGSMLVYGDPKVRKSWLVEQVAFCIGTGTPWLGFRTEQARVLIAQFEISPFAYHGRLRQMARHFHLDGNWIFEMTRPITYLDNDETYGAFVGEIRAANIQPQILIIDCLSASFGGDENDGQQMADYINKLSLMQQEFECSVVIVHHANKNTFQVSSASRARGHSRLTGWVDTLLYMAEQPNCIQLSFKARQSMVDLRNVNVSFEQQLWHLR